MDADITKTGKLIHRRDAETQSFLKSKSKSAEGASQSGLASERQVRLPVLYRGLKLDCGYRLDLVVEESVIIEIKTVDQLLEPSTKPVTSAPTARETGDDAAPPSDTESLRNSASPRLCGEQKR